VAHDKSEGNKEKKKFPVLLIIILILVLTPVLVLGYLGFIPIVSDIMGANKPKDLGVRVTEQDFISTSQKLGIMEKLAKCLVSKWI
jgi:flagellar basal body-associated protein FliL